MKTKLFSLFALTALAAFARGQEPSTMTVHEWGTFTSLQDETGRAIGGINTDDEPVPAFVHDVAGLLLIKPTEMPQGFSKGVASCHPDVTMRLETPVVYFHAPAGFHTPMDVHVCFQGGWLTQFYPQAAAVTPGIPEGGWRFGHLTDHTLGSLDWHGLRVDVKGDGPDTTDRVWLSPRAVQANGVQTQGGEQEKFLFYRGVGHLDAPLRVARSADGKTLNVWSGDTLSARPLPIGKLWLVDIRADGTAAYRTLEAVPSAEGKPDRPLASMPADFAAGDYAAATPNRLRADLRAALVMDGLFGDEADALLNTWEVSYFKSAGLRLFFLVPQPWTDAVLPLTVSGVPTITRVMVGRIELVTPQQRDLLARLAATPKSSEDASEVMNALRVRMENTPNLYTDVYTGRKSLAQAGITVPVAYQTYLELGRFRNALILDEEERHGNARLAQFIKNCQLGAYKVPADISSSP